MKNILLITLAMLPVASVAGPWQEHVESGANLELEWAQLTKQNTSQKFEFQFEPDMTINFHREMQLNIAGRLRHDTIGDIEQDQTQLHLRELTLETLFETRLGRTFLTLGKQQIVWGKADGLKVLDVVNPQDWREFILDDINDSRIPLWAVNAEIPVGDNNLQLIAILEQQYHERAEAGESYFFTSSQFVPTPPSGVPVTIEATKKPKHDIKNADLGLQLSGFSSGWDYSVNYLYHYDDNAALLRNLKNTLSGPSVTIQSEHKRSHLIGSALSNAFGDLTLRTEVGYSVDRFYSTNKTSDNDGVVKTDEFAYVFGLDWFGVSDTFISTQFFQSYLTQHKTGMLRDRTNTTVSILLEQDYFNDTLKSRVLWLHSLDNEDGLVRPKISYQLNDMTTFWLGADIFYGSAAGLYGQFDQQDRALLGTEISI